MAVLNANFKIPLEKDNRALPIFMLDLIKCMIICEDYKRESLSNVLALIKENRDNASTNENEAQII